MFAANHTVFHRLTQSPHLPAMTRQDSPQYLSNVSNAVFNNTTITHVSGNAYNSSSERYGLKLLLENISKGASHDAAERGEPPRCHPNTRSAIRAEIMAWIQAPDAMRRLILWMYGPAGSGKTAIAQSIAEECSRQGLLAATFFFGRTAAGRNDTARFVATIAYQLSRSVPETREHILSAVENDPTIFSLALATQMQVLVIEPLKSVPPLSTPIVVITDGVDECGPNRESQADLLDALGAAASGLHHIPLIFLVASRPEYEIREAFNDGFLSSVVKRLVLDDHYKPDDDIRLYLDSTFREIHHKHLRLGSPSGQFIFATTVVRFIGSPRHHPPERLDIILGLSASGNETPFALLDALYHFVLSSVADPPKVLKILTLLILGNHDGSMKLDVVEELLGFAIGPVLVDMHALVYVPSPSDDAASGLRIHHASLSDFLTDPSRSHDRYIDAQEGHAALSRCWLKVMSRYPSLPAPLRLHQCLSDFIMHCERTSSRSSGIADDLACFDIRKLLEDIRDYDDLYWPQWEVFFDRAREQAGARAEVFPRLRDEFDAFVFNRLSQYPPALRDHIPSVLVHGVDGYVQDMFRVLLYALNLSKTEIDEIRRLDSRLLGLDEHANSASQDFSVVFKDRVRAGKFYADRGTWAALMKRIVRVIFPMSRESKRQIKFVRGQGCQHVLDSDGRHSTLHIGMGSLGCVWFPAALSMASTDVDLAVLLRDHALQYDDSEFTEERHSMAWSSLAYIRRCGIPYLKHTHLPDTTQCIVCEQCRSASIAVQPRPSPMFESLRDIRASIRNRITSFKSFKR